MTSSQSEKNNQQKTVARVVGGLFALSFFLLLPTPYSLLSASAATIAVDPTKGSFGPGDTFVTTIRLELEPEECVNATTVELLYPKSWMKASAVSKGESLLTLWPEEPRVDHERGIVTFSGGIPAGYCGRVLGDPGKTNIIAKVIFTILGNSTGGEKATGPLPLALTFGAGTQVLQNDGQGTPAPLSFRGGEYTRTLTASGATNEWMTIVSEDKTPPELFDAQIVQDPQTFQGKYFLIFSTVDKQSGIHHFEVKEDDPKYFDRVRGSTDEAHFVTVTSPYVLRDQELGSRITVRAFDHAGNVQEAIVAPNGVNTIVRASGGSVSHWWWYGLGGLALLAMLVIAFTVYRSRSKSMGGDTTMGQ